MADILDVEHLFFFNPASFARKPQMSAVVAEIERVFAGAPAARYTVLFSRFPRDAISVVRRHVADRGAHGARVRVYAVGGDGILFDCLNAVIGLGNAELANIPYGTHNDFLRAFGDEAVPLFRNIELLASSPALETDVLNCDDNYALNYAAVGLESAGLMKAVQLAKRFGRARVFLRPLMPALYSGMAVATVLGSLNRPTYGQRYSVLADGVDLSGEYASISVANGPCYGGKQFLSLDAAPNDGLLNLTLHHADKPMRTLSTIRKHAHGLSYVPKETATRRAATKLRVCSDRPLCMTLDGEVFFDSEANLSVVPGAVRFAAPARLAYERRSVHEQRD